MKLKIVTAIATKVLGQRRGAGEIRADMFMPDWLLAFGSVLLCGGVGLSVAAFIVKRYILLVVAAGLFLLGIFAVLCWRNQTIRVLDEERFEYSTFLGTKKVYFFSQITGIRQNKDSMTLFVGREKVHIEKSALMTKRLSEKLNEALSEDSPED